MIFPIKMDVVLVFLFGLLFSVQGLKVNFSIYNQSSMNSNSNGPINAVDGNVLTSSITNIGLNEFWWGKFDAPHKISSMFVVVGKGRQRIFVSYEITDRPSHLCVDIVTPLGYDFINMNVSCKQTLEGDTVTVRRDGNGSLVLNEIIPIECPENTHSLSCISCPPNCINGCSIADGTCNDCKKRQFGRMCHRKCHHVCSDGTCDRNEGRCLQESLIIAVVFSLCLVFIVVSVIGFLIRRRKKLFNLFKTPIQPLHLGAGNDVLMTYSTSNRYQEGTSDPQMPTSPLSNCPVEYIHMIDGQFTVKMSPVEFLRYIDQQQNEELLLKSLVSLPGWLMGRCFEAERAENRAKNRSSTLLPYDRNRFILEPIENGDDRGDYINASYISGHKKERAYILTLGPFSNDTQLDFWRMVWQSNCKCVVMLTALREGDKKKCMQYWPEESGECGPFFVIIRHTEQFNNHVVRQMIIRKKEETRRLVHFQMTSWGDAKRHVKIDTLLQLRTSVNSITFEDDAPIIVHSGPGISRIGTYITLDILLRQGSEDNVIDIIDTVVKLRSQRAYILNVRKEHQFLLRALKVGFSPNQDGTAEDTKDDESEADIYVNAQGKGDIYVNY